MAEKPGDPVPPGGEGGVDPSMEDILASIRRILTEDEKGGAVSPPTFPVPVAVMPLPEPEPQAPPQPAPPSPTPQPAAMPDDGVVVLDPSMMVAVPPAELPPVLAMEALPADPIAGLIAPAAAAAAASSVGELVRTLAAGRSTAVHRGGPTIEDLVREEVRPLLKEWLDAHLPGLVERAVRAEIERVIGRSYP